MKQPSVKDSWAAVIQDIYDEEIDTNLLDSEEIEISKKLRKISAHKTVNKPKALIILLSITLQWV